MNPRKLISSILLFLIINSISLGCISNNPTTSMTMEKSYRCQKVDETEKIDLTEFLGEEWINHTLKRLYLAQTPKGGFFGDDFHLIEPNLDSTYYFISALALINESPYNREKTIEWLHLNENSLFQNVSRYPDELGRIYFGVMSLKLLNEIPFNRNKIIERVLSYRRENGKFVCNGRDCTWMGLKTLIALNHTETEKWALERWYKLTPPSSNDTKKVMEFMFDLYYTIEMLEMIGVDYKKLETYEEKREFLESVSQEVVSSLNPNVPLFYIAYVAGVLNKMGLLNEDFKNKFHDIIKRRKLEDGGYHIFGDVYGEHQGTYFAIMTLVMIGEKPDQDTIDFIHNRESPLGGFIFPQKLRTDPISNYIALYILRRLGGNFNRTKLKQYLDEVVYKANDPKTLWAIYESYKLSGIELEVEKREYFKNNTIILLENYLKNLDTVLDNLDGLQSFIILIRLGKELNIVLDNKTREDISNRLLSYKNRNGSFRNHLEFTAYSVILLNEMGYKYCDQETIEWLQNQQKEGGWGAPDLHNTKLVVEALTSMGAIPRDIDKLLNFLKKLQSPYGEFVISYGPENSYVYGDSYATYLALKILELLSSS